MLTWGSRDVGVVSISIFFFSGWTKLKDMSPLVSTGLDKQQPPPPFPQLVSFLFFSSTISVSSPPSLTLQTQTHKQTQLANDTGLVIGWS